MQSSERFGKEENELSLFQIDAAYEWKGEQSRSFFLAKELKRRGYSFQFVVQPGSPLHQKANEAGLPVLPVRISDKGGVLSVIRLYRAMKRKKCRLVHFHNVPSVAVALRAASLAKVPLRMVSEQGDFKYTRDVDAFIASTEDMKKDLTERRIDSLLIKVIPLGRDFSPYQENTSKDYIRQELSFAADDFLVGVMARLADQNVVKYLIRAKKYLEEHSPSIKVIILGQGPLSMELESQPSEMEGDKMFFCMGFGEDAPRILNSLDVFVFSLGLEGLDGSLIEAMACRLPVVAIRAAEIPETIIHRKTGLLVSPRSPKALAKAVIKLYENNELGSQLSQKAFEVVHERFSAESMASKVIDVYEDLARKKGVRLERKG